MLPDTIEWAVLRNDPAAVFSLAENIPDVNNVSDSGHHSLLFGAGAAGYVEAALALCTLGVVWRDNEIDILLQHALETDCPGVIRTLNCTGADLSQQVNSGYYRGLTALHIAAGRGSVDVLRALLDCDGNIETRSSDNLTPLHVACAEGQLPAVRVLIASGADLEPEGFAGCTPLHMSAMYGHCGVIDAMCDAGVDVNLPDFQDVTPLALARSKNQSEVVELLISRGAIE